MHNVKRAPAKVLSAEAIAQHRAEEEQKLRTYKEMEDTYLMHVCIAAYTDDQRARNDISHEALDSTTRLLSINPEYYSVWNYRRTILLRMFETGDLTTRVQLLQNDMMMLQQTMKTHPKVYWLWNHRRWCLQNLPQSEPNDFDGKWRKELRLVDMMLDMDARNCTFSNIADPKLWAGITAAG